MDGNPVTVDVALFYDHDCPLAGPVRERVADCLTELGIPFEIHDHVDEGRLSPTLLVDGVDVLDPQPPGTGCRLERPNCAQIRSAMTRRTRIGSG